MTNFVVLDNMVWIQRILGEELGSRVIDAIKRKCDSVVITDQMVDSYSKTIQMHYSATPAYLSTLLVQELATLHKVVHPTDELPEIGDVHRKDRHLVAAARPFRGLVITLDNEDLLRQRDAIRDRHNVHILRPDEYCR